MRLSLNKETSHENNQFSKWVLYGCESDIPFCKWSYFQCFSIQKIIFLNWTDDITLNYIFENLIPTSLIFQTMNSARLNSSGLKYQKSTTQDWRDKEIKKNLLKRDVDMCFIIVVYLNSFTKKIGV